MSKKIDVSIVNKPKTSYPSFPFDPPSNYPEFKSTFEFNYDKKKRSLRYG